MALPQAQIEKLATNAAAFETRVVASAVTFYNALGPDMAVAGKASFGAVLDGAFGWIPPVMESMARHNGINPSNFRWGNAESGEAVMAAHTAMVFLVGWGKESLRKTNSMKLGSRDRISAARWLDEILGALPVYSRYSWDGRAVRFTSLPFLTSAQRCVAYALALIHMNSRGIGERIRPCGFLPNEELGPLNRHLFIADDARQKFCCPDHANSQRQREFRRKLAPRRPTR